MKHYFNKEAFIEGLSCLLFAFTILYLIFTEKYLLFIRPGMKIYLYFTAIVMIIWSVSCFRRIAVPQYKMHLNRFLVIVVPMTAMFLPYTVIKASETTISSQVQTNQSDVQKNTLQNDTGTSQSTQQNTTGTQNAPEATPDPSAQNEADNSTGDNRQNIATDMQSNNQQGNQTQNDSSQDHQIKVPDGLDTENKTITISDSDFYAWIVQLNLYPDKYEGYTLHIHGTVYRNDYMEANEFAVTRLLMSCCVADLANYGPLCIYDNASELTEDAWVNVTGTYHYDKYGGMQVTVTGIEDAEPAEEEYIYPVY